MINLALLEQMMYVKNIFFKEKEKLARFVMSIATHVLGPVFWKNGIVFLTRHNANPLRIGEIAHQFDLYEKMRILELGLKGRGILLARKESIANLCFIEYWKRYFFVISNSLLFFLLFPLAELTQYNIACPKMPDGKVVHGNRTHIAVQKRWENENRKPLLKLSSSHYERGWDCLQQFGVPRGAWFVCLHVREPGYLMKNECANSFHAYRDADVNTYLMAVKTIVDHGGWVIRMGDPTMKPLPQMEHVIDYVHSNVRSDWMDIFCCAECRFFLGTTSGLFLVSFVFGVPCALANFAPMGERPWSGKDIFVPKLYWSITEGRYLTFKEALAPQFRYCYDSRYFESSGIGIEDNTQEDINDMVLEMLDRLNEKLEYTKEDEHLQERIYKLLPDNSYGIGSRIGSAFLRKYEGLLPTTNHQK